MFRWGILSTAKIAREHVIPAMLQSEKGIVAGIAAREKSRAQVLADRFQIETVFDDYDDLLASSQIDGVYIPIHNSGHADWSARAARHGKHVLCEKPIALQADQIDALIAARDETGNLISEAFMVTYHPQWAKVRDLLANDAIGQLRHVEGAFSFFNNDADNIRNQVDLGGGALPDIGVYPAITTRFATGAEPLRLRATVEREAGMGVDTYANVTAEYPDFTQNFYVSTRLNLYQSMAFHGERGRIRLQAPFNADVFDSARVFLDRDNGEEEFIFRGVNQYSVQCDAFIDACKDRTLPHVTLENSQANQRMIDAIYAAEASGGWVQV